MKKQKISEVAEKLLDSVVQDVEAVIEGGSPPPDGSTEGAGETNAADAKPDAVAVDSGKLQKRLKRIEKANKLVMSLNDEVAERDSEVKAAKGRLATAQEERDSAVVELSRIISDVKAGQDPLFDLDDEVSQVVASESGSTSPISELGSKQLRKLVGADSFDAAKDREEPIGLSSAQLDKLEAGEIRTIEDLETRMRDVRDWWVILANDAAAKIVTRVIDSLAAFRSKCPVPAPPETVVERLAEANAAALKTPSEWQQQFGVVIMDPDGWRRDNFDFDSAITLKDFVQRWSESTCEGFNSQLLELSKVYAKKPTILEAAGITGASA